MAVRDHSSPPAPPAGGKVYVTRSGDTWDAIAFRALGSELHMDLMLDANPYYNDVVLFASGALLNVPELPAPELTTNLPPWRIA